jgi:hypothetical protein
MSESERDVEMQKIWTKAREGFEANKGDLICATTVDVSLSSLDQINCSL